jgi:hypothetical protein
MAMTRLQIQGPELVDAQASANLRPLAIEPANGPVFLPEKRISRFFPSLGSTQSDLAAVQELPKPFDADAGNDLLLPKIVAQLRQRPLIHADQRLGRRQGYFGDLLAKISSKLPGPTRLPARIPRNASDAVGIETMNDGPNPLRRTISAFGDEAISQAASRQQDDPGMTAIDSVASLTFHTAELLLFVRSKRAYDNLVHVCVSTWGEVENPHVETFT